MKRILFFLSILGTSTLMAQSVEVQIFQNTATATTAQVGIRARTTSGTVDFIGVTFYLMYQSVNAQPQSTGMNTVAGVDDSKLVTTFNWGTSTRFTNPAQVITPAFDPTPAGGQTYDRRYIYGNSDESTPANTQTLTTTWDTLLYITFNTLQITVPQGGYAYLQQTSEAAGTALTDPAFANIPISVTSGEVPIGLGTLPVLFTKFETHCTNNGALVSWSTGSEINSNYFELQRSTNGNDWTSVGTVKAAGNGSANRTYQQVDRNGGKAYYRIKEVDLDGHPVYTSIISTNCEFKNVDMVIYPVPARDLLNVVIRSDKSLKTQLLIVDGVGKIVRRMDATLLNGSNTFLFNLKGLASGQYIIRSNAPDIEINKTFNIIR
jgi:hypothetical protein